MKYVVLQRRGCVVLGPTATDPCPRIHWIQCALSLNYHEFTTKSRFSSSRKTFVENFNELIFCCLAWNWFTRHNYNYRSMSLGVGSWRGGPGQTRSRAALQPASSKYQIGTSHRRMGLVTTVNIR